MANFEESLKIVLAHEGGYVYDPEDKGGDTRYGISKRAYPNLDISTLTLAKASSIYRQDYWNKMRLDEINNQLLANKIFDIGVNIGIHKIIQLLQQALNWALPTLICRVQEDGIMGAKTINCCNCIDQQDLLLDKFKKMIVGYYISLNKKKYINGWIKRANS